MKSILRNPPFALSLLFVALTGCVTPNRLAQRMLAPPNQQGRNPATPIAEAWSKALATRDPFLRQRVTVGDPPAELAIAELPPANYEVDFSSKYEIGADGQRFLNFHFHYQNAGNVRAVEKERGTIVLLHGYMVSKEIMFPWAFVLARFGFRVITVDLRGHGHSTGHTISFGKMESADLVEMLDQLTEQGTVQSPVSVMGISMGANLALHWAACDPRIKTVVAIAPYNQPEDAFRRFARVMKLPVSDRVTLQALGIAAERLDLVWSDWSGEAALRALRVPVFFAGGEEDRLIPKEELQYLHQVAPGGSRILLIPEATHDSIGLSLQELGPPITMWFLQHSSGASLQNELSQSIGRQ